MAPRRAIVKVIASSPRWEYVRCRLSYTGMCHDDSFSHLIIEVRGRGVVISRSCRASAAALCLFVDISCHFVAAARVLWSFFSSSSQLFCFSFWSFLVIVRVFLLVLCLFIVIWLTLPKRGNNSLLFDEGLVKGAPWPLESQCPKGLCSSQSVSGHRFPVQLGLEFIFFLIAMSTFFYFPRKQRRKSQQNRMIWLWPERWIHGFL